ncbi:MAG: hypothetical protein A4E66_02602 [Syntrophus sp. PtaB.Bin001]|nr:MAG: hypothetical protein A4E66_02602 [Syntrophus sp. PtaB.Bin001]
MSGNQGNPGNFGDFSRGCLGVTSRYDNDGGGVFPDRLSDDLPGLIVGPGCHRAGVDNAEVRRLGKGNDRVTPLGQGFSDGCRFVLIDFAA